jgi:hypothetical protein
MVPSMICDSTYEILHGSTSLNNTAPLLCRYELEYLHVFVVVLDLQIAAV